MFLILALALLFFQLLWFSAFSQLYALFMAERSALNRLKLKGRILFHNRKEEGQKTFFFLKAAPAAQARLPQRNGGIS